MRTLLFALTLLAMSFGWVFQSPTATFAQSPSGKKKPPSETKRERVGAVLGKDVFRDELPNDAPKYSDVVELFIAPVMEEFHKVHGAKYELTDDEIRSAVDWATAQMRDIGGEKWEKWQTDGKRHQESALKRIEEIEAALANPETSEQKKEHYRATLRVSKLEATHPRATEMWFLMKGRKFQQYLYDNYGAGRIIHQQLGPEALDAQYKLLLELEKKGKFEITDPELRKLAYDYWERPEHPGGFHTDRRYLAFPWTKEHQDLMREIEGFEPAPAKKGGETSAQKPAT